MFKRFFLPRKLNWFTKLLVFLNFLAAIGILLSYLATYVSPEDFWPLAFFGLAYPAILIANVFFFVFWGILRNRWMLLSLGVFVIGFNHFRHFFQLSFSGGPQSETSIKVKVLSWNVRLFDLYNWKDHTTVRHGIFDVLKREDADILCFQEFFYSGEPGYFETKDTMVTFLRAHHVMEGYTHKLRGEQYFGVAIFSAYPIVKGGQIKFENDDNNNVIWADINLGKDTLRVYNGHLSSIRFQRGDYAFIGDTANSRKWLHPGQRAPMAEQKIIERLKGAFIRRAEQSKLLLEHMKESPHPIVLAGDFNDSPVSYFYRTITSLLNDSFLYSGNGIGNTYIGRFPSFRIDYIFHSPELYSFAYQTLPEELSDHHAISCVIEMPE